MMKPLLFLLVMVFPALAAEPYGLVKTETAKCRVLTAHVADADVSYVPGRDVVDGKPVVPADPDASEEQLVPQDFGIDIYVDLEDRVTGAQGPASYQPIAEIGRVEVRNLQGDTEIDFNGQRLHRGGQQALSPECAE